MIILLPPSELPAECVQDLIYNSVQNYNYNLPGTLQLPRSLSAHTWLQEAPWKKYPGTHQFVSVDTSTDELVGFVCVKTLLSSEDILSHHYNISYSIRRDFRLRGYGTAQLQKALEFLWCKGVKTALLAARQSNVASTLLITRARGNLLCQHGDMLVYSISL